MHIFLNKNFGKNEIFFLLSCFLIIFLQSFYLREIFYDADVAGYAYNTIEIINGRGWYASTWNNKPPGINLIFILVFSLFGKSFLSIQIAVLLANLLSAFLMYLIGKFLLEEEIRLSFLLPILYALFCVSPAIGGHTGNCEVFLAVFEIAGILFLICRIL